MFPHSLWIGCVLNPGLRLDWHGRPRVGGRFLRGVSRQRRTGCVGWCWMIILVAGENDVSYGKFLYCHSHTGASFTSVDLYWLYMWYCHFFYQLLFMDSNSKHWVSLFAKHFWAAGWFWGWDTGMSRKAGCRGDGRGVPQGLSRLGGMVMWKLY